MTVGTTSFVNPQGNPLPNHGTYIRRPACRFTSLNCDYLLRDVPQQEITAIKVTWICPGNRIIHVRIKWEPPAMLPLWYEPFGFGSVSPSGEIPSALLQEYSGYRAFTSKYRWVSLYSNMLNLNSCLIQSPFRTHLLSPQC